MPRHPSFLLKIKITILSLSLPLTGEEGVRTLFTGERERERTGERKNRGRKRERGGRREGGTEREKERVRKREMYKMFIFYF